MRVVFLTSAHSVFDDRIYHHQAKWLAERGHIVSVVSSTSFSEKTEGCISIMSFDGNHLKKSEKVTQFIKRLSSINPDVIICSEPLAIYSANKFNTSVQNARIVYDVTEWYPSKKQLSYFSFFSRYWHFFKLLAFNIYTVTFVDAFIFGEWYKSVPYRKFFPNRPFVYQTYYPNINMFNPVDPALVSNVLRLCYSGKLTKEKGFDRFISVVKLLGSKHPKLTIVVKIVGWYPTPKEELYFANRLKMLANNVDVSIFSNQNLAKYIELISDTDIFFDLRDNDWENQRCLPIKLFYYTALGRPIIFSDLKAIRKEVEIDKFGSLVAPDNISGSVELVEEYLHKPELYLQHCKAARYYAENNYNWEIIAPRLDDLLTVLKK